MLQDPATAAIGAADQARLRALCPGLGDLQLDGCDYEVGVT
jgi:hypothetical protein